VKHFDLIVLGTGVAGSTVAEKCREAGWSVAIVDSRPYGGTCALRGCDPKKVLVGAAEAVDFARRLRDHGLDGDVRIDWRELQRFKRTFTEPIPGGRVRELAEAGVAMFQGQARFVGPTTVEVAEEHLHGERVLVATGSRPADLGLRGAEYLTSSDEFLEISHLPERIVFLGSGYIAFELAHVCAMAGADVTMVEAQSRPLANFDEDLVAGLVERTRWMGIDVRLETQIVAIEKRDDVLVVAAVSPTGALTFEADMVVHGGGRVPNLDGLSLDAAGVAYDERGILVDEYMQSVSNPGVYAAGDVAEGGLALTPVASFEAHVVAANLLEGNHRKTEYPPIPSVVFTLPPLASVGLREDEARERGLEFEIRHESTSTWYSSRRIAEPFSGFKVLIECETGRILGAHVLGPHADELVNLFALAMHCGLTSREIKKTMFAYPTAGSDMRYMV
jgi:glutathione reductase (NADPH)